MGSEMKPTLRGRIVDPDTRMGIEGVRVDVWDKESKSIVAVAWTDEEGSFHADLPDLPEPDATAIRGPAAVRVRPRAANAVASARAHANALPPTSGAFTDRNLALGERFELRLPEDFVAAKVEKIAAQADRLEALLTGKRRRPAHELIMIESLAELEAKEHEIVGRINRLSNGGQLFLIHPFMALAEVGVVLDRRARAEIIAREPKLRALSPVPFHALRSSQAKQNVRVNVRGLFKRREP